MTIPFGGIDLDPVELGINGNAILGIKESGKSYLGTELGEIFFDNRIPFVTYDPIGIWHNMRYPGRGKGFPIVVAGGFHGDIPLRPETAPAIVEAAMQKGVSLVLDLFHPELSKADWRRIVRDCSMLLLHKNKQYGLRHIFIEEAAEFVPQQVRDGAVYDAVERVIRMGGNSGLGCTLISPRSQEVNKAVLELCENMFLFRQRGKNALENLKKWLDVAGASGADVMRTLPSMPRGECWAWLGGSDTPVHVKVPVKRSFHPDRRAMGGDVEVPRGAAVNVSKFVSALESTLPKLEEEAKANDPKLLRAEIARLQRLVDQKTPAAAGPSPQQAQEIERLRARVAQLEVELEQIGPALAIINRFKAAMRRAWASVEGVEQAVETLNQEFDQVQKVIEAAPDAPPPAAKGLKVVQPPAAPKPVSSGMEVETHTANVVSSFAMTPARQLLLDKIAWARVFFNESSVQRQVLSFLIGKHPRTKSVTNDLGALRTAGFIEYLADSRLGLTAAGEAAAAPVGATSGQDLIDGVKSALSKRQSEILDLVLGNGPLFPENGLVGRDAIAAHFGLHPRTKSLTNDLGKMRTMGVVYYGPDSTIGAADFLRNAA